METLLMGGAENKGDCPKKTTRGETVDIALVGKGALGLLFGSIAQEHL